MQTHAITEGGGMASNYPPGVSGNEYEIAGPDYEHDSDVLCESCGGHTVEQGYQQDSWLYCNECDWSRDLPRPEPYDDRLL